jgi:aliphatic sulfonates family ABC transporter substrate-binding protein
MKILQQSTTLLLGFMVMFSGVAYAEGTIRFATLTSISKAPPGLVAEAKGYFEKHDVNVEMKLFTSGRAAIEALASGEFDIGMFGDIPALSLLAQGYEGKIIASGLGGPKRQALLVPTGSSYKSLKDLKGKRIGLTKGSTDEIALSATMIKEGMQWSDFTVVNLRPPAKATALKTGDVDAVEAWEPVPSIIIVNGIGKRLLTADGDVPDIVGVTIASKKILTESPDTVVRFLRAIHEGATYANDHPDEMVGFLSEKLRIDKEVLVEAIPTQWWYVEVYSDSISNWQASADLIHRVGRIDKPLDVKPLVDFSLLSKALGKTYPLQESASQVMRYPTISAK